MSSQYLSRPTNQRPVPSSSTPNLPYYHFCVAILLYVIPDLSIEPDVSFSSTQPLTALSPQYV